MANRKPRVFKAEHFEVKPSSIPGIGQGLFPLTTLHSGDTIGPYTGEVITDADAECEPYVSSPYVFWICRDHWVVGEGEKSTYTCYINHSYRPNCRFVVSTRWKTVRLEVIKRIRRGQEIFVDYGPEYWEAIELQKK